MKISPNMFIRPCDLPGIWRNARGASLVEYGMLTGLIAVIAISSVTRLGGKIEGIFSDASGAIEMAQLIASAERVYYLPDGSVFPAQKCYVGTLGPDILPGGGEDVSSQDCFDGLGGNDLFALASETPRDILFYLGADTATVALPGGNHWIVTPGNVTGFAVVSVGEGNSLIDLQPFRLADLTLNVSSATDMEIVLPSGGSVTLAEQFPAESIGRFIMADGEVTARDLRLSAIAAQVSNNGDTVYGTALADVISPGSGGDNIFPNGGDDIVVFTSGADTIHAYGNTGFDQLDLSAFTISQASFANSASSGIRITLSGAGSVTLVQQRLYPVGDSDGNMEQFKFADTTLSDAQMRPLSR
ncbi:hypothetical protein ACOI1H_16225 [Loktanella sp. DJP18]|uniref:hypothetical protein n=1 Tax=Loktanella sp. DJP18 TaxID=3409788 RepID=UPI003BB50630